jgi:hypothetical protein
VAEIALAVTLHCDVCGDTGFDDWDEADKRAERHTKVTGHATAVRVEAKQP